MSNPEDDGGFLGRWAKRKQQVQLQETRLHENRLHENRLQETSSENQASKQALLSAEQPAPAVPASSQAGLPSYPDANLPLPSLDDVLPGGDVSAFLQKHVPDSLRNLALRKAWLSDPEISGFIEMADYQWDFTNPDSIPGWSSTLEGIDVRAMVEKVFNNITPAKEPEVESVESAPEEEETEQASAPQNIIHNAENESFLPDFVAQDAASDTSPAHVAVQNNTEISSVYAHHKKRHGSALPT